MNLEKKKHSVHWRNYLWRDNTGIALAVVMAIIAILASVVVEFSYSSRVNVEITGNLRNALHAQYIAESGIEVAKALLISDLNEDEEQGKQIDFKATELDMEDELWSQTGIEPYNYFPIILEDGGEIGSLGIRIVDENSKVQINGLVKSDGTTPDVRTVEIIKRLFASMDVEEDYVDSIVDWIDIDDVPYGLSDAESNYYLNLTKPYIAKNTWMNSPTELNMIRDINDEIYGQIMGYSFDEYSDDPLGSLFLSTAILPSKEGASSWKINVNTALPPVLQALSDDITDSDAEEIVSRREEEGPFESVGDFTGYLSEMGITIPTEVSSKLDVKSDIFSIRSTGLVNDTIATIRAVVKRTKNPTPENQSIEILYWKMD